MESNTQGPVPKSIIPPSGEIILHGITDQFMPTIAKCSLGGWIVVIPGKGIASFTTLEEAMHFVGDAAHEYMGIVKEPIPEGIKPEHEDNVAHIEEYRRGPSVGGIVASITAAIALVFSGLNTRLW